VLPRLSQFYRDIKDKGEDIEWSVSSATANESRYIMAAA